ncbi:hypothetical protein [Hyalangium rubrum]|uniref:Uncharacterized protein n=1 Tax=Hyalangium rubrum TaxID=3103134 RepID=A0ABU5HAW3_9BACT|nr:hypothetical protein [Hyalangium sp. s54d21]MDY7230615.1 hypothetical protein [Hyalangium sp. s54d21]
MSDGGALDAHHGPSATSPTSDASGVDGRHDEPQHREPRHREPQHREPQHREPQHREPQHYEARVDAGGLDTRHEPPAPRDARRRVRPTRRRWLPSWRARHGAKLELFDARTTGPSWGRDDGSALPFAPPF